MWLDAPFLADLEKSLEGALSLLAQSFDALGEEVGTTVQTDELAAKSPELGSKLMTAVWPWIFIVLIMA